MNRNHNELSIEAKSSHRIAAGILLTSCVVFAILFGITSPVSGQDAEQQDKSKLTIKDIKDVDKDFHYMGEYQGMVRTVAGGKRAAGLQVVPLGDGEFSAMHYDGGLPGTGWNLVDRDELTGTRSGALLELASENTRVEIVNDSAMIFNKEGRIVGELAKVHRKSPTLGKRAPANALTLFDSHDTMAFKNGKMTDDGLLMEGTELLSTYRDFTLHVEYLLPYMPYARGQGRSNSGLYLLSSYEVQILDSFGLEGIENECGALYRYKRPDQNMCLPPLQWQTYDLTFRSPKFDSNGNKIQNARITVLHNGVAVHNNFEVERKTGAGQPESDKPRAIKFQDHSNPVRFRNIWLIDLEQKSQPQLAANWPSPQGEYLAAQPAVQSTFTLPASNQVLPMNGGLPSMQPPVTEFSPANAERVEILPEPLPEAAPAETDLNRIARP